MSQSKSRTGIRHGRRVYRRYCETMFCGRPVAAIAMWRYKRGRVAPIRFEMCERCTLVEIARRADGDWAGNIVTLPRPVGV